VCLLDEASELGVAAEVRVDLDNDNHVWLERADGRNVTIHREGLPDRNLPLPRRELGDLLAEELHRLDPDRIYGDALGTATSKKGLNRREEVRVHKWLDPASPESADAEPGLFGPAAQRPTTRTPT